MRVTFLIFVSWFLFDAGIVRGQQREPTITSARSSIFVTYPKLKEQAADYGGAFVGKDFERLVDLTWTKYVEEFGRQALLSEVAQTAQILEAHGASLISWAPGEATQMLEESGVLYAVVPTTLKIKVGEQTSDSCVCVIAISTDRGEHWQFISSSCVKLNDAFPQVAEKLILCGEKESVKL